MDPCKEKELNVIDTALIEKCIKLQFPKGEPGRLAQKDGVPINEVEHIRIEYMNILKIDHLWVLSSLTKLSLSNNYIEVIENLDTLVNLMELDLSFNKISKIENLDKLKKLEKLTFYENLITEMENMDELKDLTIFSIGRNYIDDRDNIIYLRKFPKLLSLNMSGNPCAETDDFRYFVGTFLPHIVYYEYKMVQPFERETGAKMFSQQLQKLEEEEEKIRVKREEEEQKKQEAELHSLSFVEYLNSRQLFDQLFQGDEEGLAFLDIGEEAQEFYDEFEEQFIDLCRQVFEVGQRHYAIRKDEVDQFMHVVDETKKDNQMQSIHHMEAFIDKKSEIFLTVKNLQNAYQNIEIEDDPFIMGLEQATAKLEEEIPVTWKVLMKLELQLYEQLEEVNQTFEHTLNDLINNFLEEAQGVFSLIRALEVTYSENMGECAGRYLTTVNITENIHIPPSLVNIMSDREAVTNAVAASHDLHMVVIDQREDLLVSRAKNWFNTLITNLQKDEIIRNRDKIIEINHFLDIQREEFHTLKTEVPLFVKKGSEESIV